MREREEESDRERERDIREIKRKGNGEREGTKKNVREGQR